MVSLLVIIVVVVVIIIIVSIIALVAMTDDAEVVTMGAPLSTPELMMAKAKVSVQKLVNM